MFAIIGRGFGAYGYKPALDMLGLSSRFIDRGEQVTDDNVVIAVPPAEQPKIARDLLKNPAVKTLLLEKPLAPSPVESMELLGELKASGKKFRIGYLFGNTTWSPPEVATMYWAFMAHHFANDLKNWKRELGVVSFYGIHVIALLADMGYTGVVLSHEKESEWDAVFSGKGLLPFRVHINAQAVKTLFSVDTEKYPSPFGHESRVQVLARSLFQFLTEPQPEYGKELKLWAKVKAA